MIPEILRTNVNTIILLLKSIGIDNIVEFDFMDRPVHEVIIRALE